VDGITPTMLAFDWESDVAPQAIKINWKEDTKNLTKLFPRVAGEEGDDLPADPGSFFNYFEHADDPFDVSSFALCF
jgi:template-activating factor I